MTLRRRATRLGALVGLAALAAFGVDAAARRAAEDWGSEAAGAPVHIASVDVSLFHPQLLLHGLVVENPSGFEAGPALSVGRLAVGVDLRSLTGDVVSVTQLAADGFELRYSRSGGQDNLGAIESNLLAFLERRGLASQPRLVVERLEAREGRASAPVVLGRAGVPLQSLQFRDIGRREGGLPPPALVAALFDLMEPSLANALAHTDYDGLLRRGARGAGEAARKLKGLFE